MNWLKLILDVVREVPAVVKSLRQMPRPRKVEGVPIPRKMDEDKERQIKSATENFRVPPPRKPRTRYDE